MAVRAMYEYGGFWSLYVFRPGLGMVEDCSVMQQQQQQLQSGVMIRHIAPRDRHDVTHWLNDDSTHSPAKHACLFQNGRMVYKNCFIFANMINCQVVMR